MTYDLSKPSGSRVVSVLVRCSKCKVPRYEKLNNETVYTALTGDFLRGGGDGYKMFSGLKWSAEGVTTDAVLIDHFKLHSPVHPEVSWRINFVSTNETNTSTNVNSGSKTSQLSLVTVLLISIGLVFYQII